MAAAAAEEFQLLDLRVGRVRRAEPNERGRKPAYKLWIDFGPDLGVRHSSAQLTDLYTPPTWPAGSSSPP